MSSSLKDSSPVKQYFPVWDFIRNEIAAVDSLPVGIMQYKTSAEIHDSGYIKPAAFHKLASEFLPEGINDSVFTKEFDETAFFDKSSNTATFYYSTKNVSLPVRRVDVMTTKGDVYDNVKSIYIEKSFTKGDSSVTKKMYWKTGRNFQVVTQASKGKSDPSTELVKVVWDNRE